VDNHSLQMFLHLSSSLHFGRTSLACNISPSALSRTIQRLEEELGSKLFIRDRRSVTLTESGKKLREYARKVLDGWQGLRDELEAESGRLEGEIALYCSVTAAQAVLSGIFQVFRERHPGVHIKLETGDSAHAIDRILDGSADLTIAARPDSLPDTVLFTLLATTPLVFIAPRVSCEVTRRLAANAVAWETVPMILADRALSRKRAEAWFRSRSLRPTVYAEVSGHEAILAMVRLGCGVGVVPKLVLEQSALRDEVQLLNVLPQLEPYRVGACVHQRRLESPVVAAFRAVVLEAALSPIG